MRGFSWWLEYGSILLWVERVLMNRAWDDLGYSWQASNVKFVWNISILVNIICTQSVWVTFNMLKWLGNKWDVKFYKELILLFSTVNIIFWWKLALEMGNYSRSWIFMLGIWLNIQTTTRYDLKKMENFNIKWKKCLFLWFWKLVFDKFYSRKWMNKECKLREVRYDLNMFV